MCDKVRKSWLGEIGSPSNKSVLVLRSGSSELVRIKLARIIHGSARERADPLYFYLYSNLSSLTRLFQ